MELLYPHCAGLDVHKDTVVACVRHQDPKGRLRKQVRTFSTVTRQRTQLVAEKATVANRIQKVLEDANLKLGSVAADVLGKSGRAILQALIGGETDPEKLADLALRRLRQKIPQLRLALEGRVT